MTAAHDYLSLRDEMLVVSARSLELAAQVATHAANDSIMANRLRLMAELAGKIIQSTEARMVDLAATGSESDG